MPETIRLTLDFDKQKYNGLSEQLKKRNVTIEEALEKNLEGLYQRYVPEAERKAIAEKTRFDCSLIALSGKSRFEKQPLCCVSCRKATADGRGKP